MGDVTSACFTDASLLLSATDREERSEEGNQPRCTKEKEKRGEEGMREAKEKKEGKKTQKSRRRDISETWKTAP